MQMLRSDRGRSSGQNHTKTRCFCEELGRGTPSIQAFCGISVEADLLCFAFVDGKQTVPSPTARGRRGSASARCAVNYRGSPDRGAQLGQQQCWVSAPVGCWDAQHGMATSCAAPAAMCWQQPWAFLADRGNVDVSQAALLCGLAPRVFTFWK